MAVNDKRYKQNSSGNYYVPADSEPRIDGAKESINGLMDHLGTLTDSKGKAEKDIIRTGMIPYNRENIQKHTKNMQLETNWRQ